MNRKLVEEGIHPTAPQPPEDSPPRNVGQALADWAVPIIAFLFLAGMVVTYFQLSRNYEHLVERTALQHAAVYSHTLDKFRALYASEVVDTARGAGLQITHDYLTEPNAIPLPITLTRGLEDEFAAPGSGTQTKMYSPLPFPWRQKEGGLKDKFARDAWEALNDNPDEPYYRIESYDGVPAMRYAIAETLKPECVSCHNDYEGSPKTDWKVGDVRGVLEVVYPLHNAATLSRSSIWETMGTLTPMLLIALALLGFAMNQHRRWARTLHARVRAQEQALAAREENRDLRTKIEHQARELSQMLQSLPLGVLVLDPHGEVRYANDYLDDVLGGRLLPGLWSGDDAASVAFVADTDEPYPVDKLPSVLALQGVSSSVMDFEWVDGERRVPLLVSGAPILDEDGNVTMAIVTVQDISDQRRLENEAQQAQRIYALGQLAGAISHDFNNLLTVFVSCSTKLMRDLPRDHPGYKEAEQVYSIARRAESLTQQLLAFSEHRGVNSSVVSPNVVIRGTLEMLRRLLHERFELRADLESDLLNVRCDQAALDQVLMNLALNSRDAMPGGGTVEITAKNVTVTVEYARAQELELAPGEYVMLTVEDDGVGMDESTRRRIFEPFFTTKSRGKGTGLGLSTCWGIVRKLGGLIRVESTSGAGTSMHVYLPGVRDAVTESQPGGHVALGRGGDEFVVVAEDHDDVRQVVVQTLSDAGYQVLEAVDGREAFELCEVSPPGSIDLLLTDVVMPRMNGPALAREARLLHPDIRVLFISGYTDDGMLPSESGPVDLLQKPFEPEQLLRRVRQALSRDADETRPEAS